MGIPTHAHVLYIARDPVLSQGTLTGGGLYPMSYIGATKRPCTCELEVASSRLQALPSLMYHTAIIPVVIMVRK